MTPKPKVTSSLAEQELVKAEKQFEAFDENLKSMSKDRLDKTPTRETEPLNRLSQSEIEKSKEVYLKPVRAIGAREKFNEDYRKEYEFAMEFVQFIPEHKEIIGEAIELWTKPFAGMPCEFWKVPVGKPVWGPRHLAERIAGCKHHRFIMQQNTVMGSDGMGQYYGSMAVDTTIQRLDAIPVSSRKSIFMGAANF